MMHTFESKPGKRAICRNCGVELRLVTVTEGQHSRKEVEYRAPNETLFQIERIPCGKES
jgi:hypothetical protein